MAAAALGATSCLSDYLDKSPDSGLSEQEVFSKYANFKNYFFSVYNGSSWNIKCHYPLYFAENNQKFTLEGLTDICDMTRMQRCQPIKLGDSSQAIWAVGYNTGDQYSSNAAKVTNTWKCIRVCNMAIDKIDMLQDATTSEKEDLLAQAYFVRAYCNFEIFRIYGAVPYVDKVLGANDEWDLPCPDDREFLEKCAEDFQTAADHFDKAGLMRRDPASGAGNLSDADQDKPNGVTALAMKGRVMLYAASPLNNHDSDKTLWEEAAEANAVALNAALSHGYVLLPKADFTKNFYGNKYTNEQLWAYSTGSTTNYNSSLVQAFVPYPFSNNTFSSGQCPTQNFVDRFETADGYALNTADDRAVATAAKSYNEQDPFSNRDPRLGFTVIYNQKTVQGYGSASLYVEADGSYPSGSLVQKTLGSTSETFYYECKRTGPLSNKGNQNVILTDPIIRLAEVYLNYAEAANEAWGPQGKSSSATLTALEAVNTVRTRVGMPDVRDEYTSSADLFRDRIKNERTVELCFEGYHYYCDVRRWMDAPALGRISLTGMRPVKVNVSTEYPTGFRYERFDLPSTRQITWKDGMYWIPFQTSDLLKMKNYTPKQSW